MAGYGVDSWAGEYLVSGRLARGVNVVANAAVRRQITPRGTLIGGEAEESFGIDLSGFVGSTDPAKAAAMLPSMIRTELTKDERIADVSVSVSYSVDTTGSATFELSERIVPYDASESFTLVMAVSAVSARVVGLTS